MNIENIYQNYLSIKPKYDKDETLFLTEADNRFFAFNRSAFTIREIFNSCVCSEIIQTKKNGKNHIFYTAIPKWDYDLIITKIAVLKIRTVFITPL